MSNTNVEFISAKDLPMTEAEEVNVLCVEDGALKLKSASNLGGGAVEEPKPEWDAIIEMVNSVEGKSDVLRVVSGDYNTIYNKIMVEGVLPNVIIKTNTQYYGNICYSVERVEKINVVTTEDGEFIAFERPDTFAQDYTEINWIIWNSDNELDYN